MKKGVILLKEKITSMLEVLKRMEESDAELTVLDCDILLNLMRETYQSVLDMNKPEVEETEPLEGKIDRMVEKHFKTQSESQEQLMSRLEQRLDTMLNEKLSSILTSKLEAIASTTMVAATIDRNASAPQTDARTEKTIATETPIEEVPQPKEEPSVEPQPELTVEIEPEIQPEPKAKISIETPKEPVTETPKAVPPVAEKVQPTDEAPLFAPEEPVTEPVKPNDAQTMEQLEGHQNESLFEEPQPKKPAAKENSTTLWDMLQPKEGTASVADRFKPGHSLVDQYKVNDKENPSVTTETPTKAEVKNHEHTTAAPKQEEPKPVEKVAQPVAKPVESAPQPKPVQEKKESANGSIFEMLHHEAPQAKETTTRTLADQLSNNKPNIEQSIEEKVNAHKVTDLRTVISISDKFQFMNDLFHNNMKAYNDFILQLNAAPNRAAGLEVMAATAASFNWDKDSLTVKKFQTIFDRRF